MKIKIFAMMLSLFLAGYGVAFAQKKDKAKKNDKETVLFDVSMTCQNCQKKIEKNIAFEKGVTDMKVDLPNKTVAIEFKKDKTTAEELQSAITKLGYTAKVHEAEAISQEK